LVLDCVDKDDVTKKPRLAASPELEEATSSIEMSASNMPVPIVAGITSTVRLRSVPVELEDVPLPGLVGAEDRVAGAAKSGGEALREPHRRLLGAPQLLFCTGDHRLGLHDMAARLHIARALAARARVLERTHDADLTALAAAVAEVEIAAWRLERDGRLAARQRDAEDVRREHPPELPPQRHPAPSRPGMV
jgi:hypothetical protein